MSKFITPVSMKVTEEQFNADLKNPLKDMGYKIIDYSWDDCDYFMTSSNNSERMYPNQSKGSSRVHYIDHYNPELFLALAAMTNEEYGIAGEWWVNKARIADFSIDELYQSTKPLNQSMALFDNNKRRNGAFPNNLKFFRKATKEELIKYFTKTNKLDMSIGRTITAKQAQYIINVACTPWKSKLAEKWSKDIVLNNKIEISEDFYKEMRTACTKEQNKLFDEIFGVEETWFPGELYWIKRSLTDDIWELRYASHKIGAFYVDQHKQGHIQYWSTYQLAKGVKLPD